MEVKNMNESNQYKEQFSPDELGRSGNGVVNIVRDSRTEDEPEDSHWDVTEVDESGEYDTFHVMDSGQTWLGQDF